jgi:hypothetical protein
MSALAPLAMLRTDSLSCRRSQGTVRLKCRQSILAFSPFSATASGCFGRVRSIFFKNRVRFLANQIIAII